MRTQAKILGLTASLLLLTSCSGGSAADAPPTPASTPPPPVVKSFVFPSGDATAQGGGTAWDIVGLKTSLSGRGNDPLGNSYDTLKVDVVFTQTVTNALPAPGSPLSNGNQLGIHISVDSDGNPSTGNSAGCMSGSMPFEYITDQGNFPSRLSDGNYTILSNGRPIYSGPSNPQAEAVTQALGNTVSFTFSLASLGVFSGSSIPHIGIAASALNGLSDPATDCVPLNGMLEVFTS